MSGWIKKEERLPENMSRVLVTIKFRRKGPNVRSGTFYNGFFMNDNGDTWKATDKAVKAWMPAPIPYGAESEAKP